MKNVRFKGGQVRIDLEKVDMLQAAFKTKMRVRVGILGEKAQRDNPKNGSGSVTNAEIGMVHEYGSISRNIPPRSFLKGPLVTRGRELLRAKDIIWACFLKNQISLKTAYVRLGVIAEQIIDGAFKSKGYGTWPDLKHRKGNPLIDTGQLRRSIMSKVVE